MDDLTITATTGKRIAAGVAIVSLLVNVAGWAGSRMVDYSQLRTRVEQIADGGSVALQKHTVESTAQFGYQERRLVRLETIEEQNAARLANIERDVKEILKELRSK